MFITTINPATEKPIARYKVFSPAQVSAAVKKAREKFAEWEKFSAAERAKLLKNISRLLKKNMKKYAEQITTEMGKPIKESKAEIEKCALLCDYYSENAEKFLEDEIVKTEHKKSFVSFEPLGVIGCIMPWNFPFWQVFRFAVPALTVGNTVVLKHSSVCPGTALEIEKLFQDSGYQKGVFQTVIGGPQVGEALVNSGINAVSITGSVSAGKRIAELAAPQIKKFVLELGGSDPFIVLRDADLKFACESAVKGRMINTGQSCIAAKRFIIVKSRVKEFTEKFVEIIGNLKVGDPMDEETDVGPMVSLKQLEFLHGQVKDSIRAGAKLLLGGHRLPGKGFFYEPTVLGNCTRKMRVVQEETFGPVSPIIAIAGEKAAIAEANNSEFGLGASIWTRDRKKGERLAREIEAGVIFVNGIVKSDPRLPFGGIKKSGIGRELSRYGILEFVNVKSIVID